MSSGFDAAAGDVGNCRNFPDMRCERGMDLSPEDFGWATSEVLKVADLCCAGKVVSVLEGGYGEYASSKMGGLCVKGPARTHTPATRHGTRNGAIPLVESPSAVSVSTVVCFNLKSFFHTKERAEQRRAFFGSGGPRAAPG
jgi:hypothetical protein